MLFNERWELDAVSKQLLNAADYMEEHGWCQGEFRDTNEAVCLQEALRSVDYDGRDFEAYSRLKDFLDHSPTGWNDFHCKSKEEAIATLRAAARSKS